MTWDTRQSKVVSLKLPLTPFSDLELVQIKPREWLYGNHMVRRFVSVLGAPGGTGKTAYVVAVAISVALGIDLLGETVHDSGAVSIYNLEDPRDELLRRIWATCLHHRIDPLELRGRLFCDSGRDRPLIIVQIAEDGTIVATPLFDAIIESIRSRGIKLFIVDPFSLSHEVQENRNDHIAVALALWSAVADRADCVVWLVHHNRKGFGPASPGDAHSFRGASALVDGARAALSLSPMSDGEAGNFAVEEEVRRFLFRADNAKLNLAPPAAHTAWFRLNSVKLPTGDYVQAVDRWQPPGPWDGLPMSLVIRIMDQINRGPSEGEKYTYLRRSTDLSRWAGSVVIEMAGKTDRQAQQIIEAWIKNGLLVKSSYRSEAQRKDRSCLNVNELKLAQMGRSEEPSI